MGVVAVRNVWKGMVIGALTGAAAGLVLDLGERGTEKAVALGGAVGGAVARRAPELADLALDLGERGADRAATLGGAVARHAPELSDHLRQSVTDASSAAADRVRGSSLPSRTKAAAEGTRDKVSSAVSEGLHRVTEIADQGKDKVALAVDRAGETA
jgi:hypothetical protein